MPTECNLFGATAFQLLTSNREIFKSTVKFDHIVLLIHIFRNN